MAKPITILLLALFFMLTVRPLLPFLEYVVNYKTIVSNLCIDRDKPESHCNGKCYLKKRLKEINREDAASARRFPVNVMQRDYSPVIPERNSMSLFPSGTIGIHFFFYSFSSKEYISSLAPPPPKAFLC